MTAASDIRLTQYASGGGCACKIPPGELEEAVSRLLPPQAQPGLLIVVR
jgi:selenide,water dikinase